MPRSHKRSSRGKARKQLRHQHAAEQRKARGRREAENARRLEQLAAERDERQRERFDKYANYPGNRPMPHPGAH